MKMEENKLKKNYLFKKLALIFVFVLVLGNFAPSVFAAKKTFSNTDRRNDISENTQNENEQKAVEQQRDQQGAKIDKSKIVPDINLKGNRNLGVLEAGKKNNLNFVIENKGNSSANNIEIRLVPSKEDEKMFSTTNLKVNLNNLRIKKSEKISIPFELNEATEAKVYDMELKFKFKNHYGYSFEKSVPVFFKVNNTAMFPYLVIDRHRLIESANKDEGELEIVVKNTGDLVAVNPILKITNLSENSLELASDSDTKRLDSLALRMIQSVKFNLKKAAKISGTKELELKFNYKDKLGKQYEQTSKIKIDFGGSENAFSDISLNFNKRQYFISGKSQTTAVLNVTNNSDEDVKNLDLRLGEAQGIKYMSRYIDIIKLLKKGETKSFSYTFAAADPENEGTFPITATLKTGKGDNEKSKIEITSVTTTKGSEKNTGQKPKIIIHDYKVEQGKIIAGQEFDLIVMVKNTSNFMGVKNLKINYSSDDGMFIPVGAANSFFIPNIKPNGVYTQKIKLKTKRDAEVKMYNMTFKIDYEDINGVSYDSKGNPYTSEEQIALQINQEIRLSVPEDITVPKEVKMGEGFNLDLEFYNLGKSTLYNLVVNVKGDLDIDTPTHYVGNFEAGKSEIYSGKFTPRKQGKTKATITFSFEDSTGKKHELVREIDINGVDASGGAGGMGMDDLKGEDFGDSEEFKALESEGAYGGSEIPIIPIAIVGALLLVAIIIFIIRRRKKAMMSFMGDINED